MGSTIRLISNQLAPPAKNRRQALGKEREIQKFARDAVIKEGKVSEETCISKDICSRDWDSSRDV